MYISDGNLLDEVGHCEIIVDGTFLGKGMKLLNLHETAALCSTSNLPKDVSDWLLRMAMIIIPFIWFLENSDGILFTGL